MPSLERRGFYLEEGQKVRNRITFDNPSLGVQANQKGGVTEQRAEGDIRGLNEPKKRKDGINNVMSLITCIIHVLHYCHQS